MQTSNSNRWEANAFTHYGKEIFDEVSKSKLTLERYEEALNGIRDHFNYRTNWLRDELMHDILNIFPKDDLRGILHDIFTINIFPKDEIHNILYDVLRENLAYSAKQAVKEVFSEALKAETASITQNLEAVVASAVARYQGDSGKVVCG